MNWFKDRDNIPATHPGGHLGEILDDLNISVSAFAEKNEAAVKRKGKP